MRDGNWSTGTVRNVSASIAGVEGAGSTVSVQRSLPSSLPGQVAAVGGRSAATADLSLAQVEGVTDRVGSPWSRRWWARSGDPVTVDATNGVDSCRLFTGRVDGTKSSFADLDVAVALVDDTDNLSAQVSERPLFREMPPRTTTGEQRSRMTGLVNTYLPVLAARAAGYYNTPAMTGYCLVSVPMVGSMWPERGVLDESYRSSDVGGWHRYHPGVFVDYTPGTGYMAQAFATYVPDPYNAPWSGGITAERPLSITLGARQNLSTSMYVSCQWIDETYLREIRLSVTGTRNLSATFVGNGGSNWTGSNTVVWIGAGDLGAWEYATLKVSRISDNMLEWQITTDTGVVKTARTHSRDTGRMIMDVQWNKVITYVPEGCGMNGVQVGYSSGPPPAESFRRTFVFRPDTPLANLAVLPALASEPAGDLLNRQAEVENAAVWLDEDGILRWLGRQRMVSQPVVRTLTSSEIADASVRMDAQDVRRKVSVRYTAWATRVTRRSSIVVHEGSQDEYVDGDYAEQIITPPSDEQWVHVDSNLRTIYGGNGVTQFNDGQGSFHGYTALKKNGDEISDARGGLSQFTFAPIGPGSWKWTFNVQALPTGADRVKTITRSEDGTDLKGPYRGLGLPLLRGMGVATSSDETATSRAVGPSWAPELEIDASWFIQDPDTALARAQWVADQLREQRPTLSDIKVLPDPRLQLGDKVRITETVRTGLAVVGNITAISHDIGPGSHEMTIGLTVLEVSLDGVTFTDFDTWYDGMTLSGVDTLFKSATFAQHDNDPLRD